MRILAANPDTLGDFILRQPMYHALAAEGHELMLTVRSPIAGLAADIAPGARLAPFDIEPYRLAVDPQSDRLSPLLKTIREFAPEALLVAPFQWTLMEEWLAGNLPGVRVMGMKGHLVAGDPRWGQPPQSTLHFDDQVGVPKDSTEIMKNQALASLVLGRHVNLPDPAISIGSESIDKARAQLASCGLTPGEYWIGWVGHGRYKAVRNWNLENWSSVLNHWITTHQRQFLLMGSDEERQATEDVRFGVKGWAARNIKSLCGDRPLDVVAGLIALSRGYIGRDTGPMHLAAALGKPVIAVFGGGTWPRFQPAATPSWIAMLDVPCVGCDWQCAFDESYCVRGVPVQDVCQAIDDIEAGRLTHRVVRKLEPSPAIYQLMIKQAPANAQAKLLDSSVAKQAEWLVREHALARQLAERQAAWETERAISAERQLQLQSQIYQIQATLGGLESDLARQQNQLSRTETELADCTAALAQTQSKLSDTGAELSQTQDRLLAAEERIAAGQASLAEQDAELSQLQQSLQSEQSISELRRGAMQDLETRLSNQDKINSTLSDKLSKASALLSRLAEAQRSDRQANQTVVQSLLDANRTLDSRVRLLMTSRLMRAGWKVGLGKTPQWPDLLIDPPQLPAGAQSSQETALRDLTELLGSSDTSAAPPAMRAEARNRRPWPYSSTNQTPLPSSLPGGKPWPKISIVTASYNQGQYIEQTILSVLNQDYPNVEYIIMDGGSTDATPSILDRYRDRIAHVVSEKDKGQSNAINKGFALSTGQLMTWLNSDDMLEPGALAAMAMAFHTSGADMVAGICTLHTDGKILGRHLTSCGDGPLPLEDLLDIDNCWTKGQFFYQPEVMFTRELWQRAGGHLDESLYFSMDYELWLRFAEQAARLHVIGRKTAIYRVHERQKTFEMEKYRPELTGVRDRFEQRTARAAGRNGKASLNRTHLRVVFFNDLGSVAGAGIAHQRLASAMALAGHEVIPLAIAPNLVESSLSCDAIISAIADRTPDLVMLGNIHSARLDPALIGKLSERWPTVQILHDLYSLTGRCPYPGDCTKYLHGCDDACPTAHEYPTLAPALIQVAWRKKVSAMVGEHPPIIAGVSDWTTQFAQNRFADVPAGIAPEQSTPKIVGLRYGLPLDVFKPYDKSTARQLLGLPHDRFLILFSAGHLSETRKGLVHLIEALESSGMPDILAVCIGHFDAPPQVKNFEVRSMGYMADPHSLAMLYSAVDLFVGPSLIETFGQVFIEAAACGTPSVGYATAGGVAEAVADGISGRLAPRQDSAELKSAVQHLYSDPGQRRDMGAWGRLWIENERSYFSAYHRLFAELKKIGLIRRLNLPPKVSFFHDTSTPISVTYLEPGCQPAPDTAPASGDNATSAQLLSRIAGLETERDCLRLAMRNITQTRLWRMVAYTYPKYQRLLGKPFIPRFARRAVHGTAQWLADRPNGQR